MTFQRVVAAAVCLFVVTPILACRCLEPASTEQAYENAQAVILASVDSVDGVGDSLAGARARLSVKEAWKSDVVCNIEVSTSTTCAFDFRPGNEYLLYLYSDKVSGQWNTRICVGNTPADGAAAALEWLRLKGLKAQIRPPR